MAWFGDRFAPLFPHGLIKGYYLILNLSVLKESVLNKYLDRIHGEIPNKKTKLDIKIGNKNLIITGRNGSGKTHFLTELFKTIKEILTSHQTDSHEYKLNRIETLTKLLKNEVTKNDRYYNLKSELDTFKAAVSFEKTRIIPSIPELSDYLSKTQEQSAVTLFFEANRKAEIAVADAARGIDSEKKIYKSQMSNTKIGSSLEKHLVNLKGRSAHAFTYEKDSNTSLAIESWFLEFEKNLKFLMEDDTTKLEYNPNTFKFIIQRKGMIDSDFQTLSSGYASIFDIYSELLMRAEYLDLPPDNISGLVFIDEIEAHLHVSLQRLILPFFEHSFPNIQFIITTHSPFILTSVDNAVMYDISTNTVTDKDLSLYTYSAVMEGILGTKSTSKILDDLINEIAIMAQSSNINTKTLREHILKVSTSENSLDSRSKAFYLLGVNALMDAEQKNV